MGDGFLNKVYAARDAAQTRALYDDWAKTYDAEVGESGYATPRRCAQALAEYVDDLSAPILDFGCGTGLSGAALAQAGFTAIDGVDLSADMLKQAAEKQVYRNLSTIEADSPPVERPGQYTAIAAIGVIGAGAAPISVFDSLMHALPSQGKLVLSFNDHALEDPANEGRLSEWMDCGAARLLFKEHGPHLPGIGLNSTVYIIEKA
ncbi:methyltransferase domain-containing protein [Aliishimia ponticola]|uniref:Methyltransferase domain-containing protein n=1 Tax=Aliishimia ponticola TaxID=2499833 RepID=A0A4S4NFM7_9RHOB|nr:methyltransferase domain-containing protein [Aliishimia ponticola]THH38402.1 methyltransferase domain-containing protein [Aliishimia ponticola]